MEEKKEPKYKKHSSNISRSRSILFQHMPDFELLEIKRATKRKHAEIKLTVPDEFTKALMHDEFIGPAEDYHIRGLVIEWHQKEKS